MAHWLALSLLCLPPHPRVVRALVLGPTIGHALAISLARTDQCQHKQRQAEDGLTGEPHYYVLGQKAVGASSRCTMPQAFEQIKKTFARIGGRSELDLYETVRRHKSV